MFGKLRLFKKIAKKFYEKDIFVKEKVTFCDMENCLLNLVRRMGKLVVLFYAYIIIFVAAGMKNDYLTSK